MSRVPSIVVYAGINALIAELNRRKVPLAIVTKSPDMIPREFAKHHGWPISNIIGYHQVRRRKPDPEALRLAMKQAGVNGGAIYHIGDHAEDTEAARSAGIIAIGAAWGAENLDALRASNPDHLFESVGQLSEFLLGR